VRISFDRSIDRGSWPGALHDAVAVDGHAWVGPQGLVERLETLLGLGGPRVSRSVRACQLVARLRGRDGWWAASMEADPLGTADRLLRDRDALRLCGWHGEPASDRLASLWQATEDVAPGLPDRIDTVVSALGTRSLGLASVNVFEPFAALEPAWRALLARLSAAGVLVEERPLAPATASGDLQAARTARFVPSGDRTLTLFRPHGPIAAADEVAAALAARASVDGVLIIAADEVLERALRRHGLPGLGCGTDRPASAGMVRLVVEAAFTPMDAADLHAFLCFDPGPIPRSVASRLIDALRERPGRNSVQWREALDEGLSRLGEPRRSEVAARVGALLVPAGSDTGALEASEIVRRLRVLGAWANMRASSTPSLVSVAQQAADAVELLELLGDVTVTRVALQRLCDEVPGGVAAAAAEVGLAAVDGPGAVLGPAETIIWWGFTRTRAPAVARLRLSERERSLLESLGVTPPVGGQEMAAEAGRWRRPLEQATRHLAFVCPRTDDAGDSAFPHPLWDELRAAVPDAQAAARLEAANLELPARAARRTVVARELPVARKALSVGRSISLRDPESPSSIEGLLGCSLQWALQHRGQLREGLSGGPPGPGPLLNGIVAHDLLARIFRDGVPASADDAHARATAQVTQHLEGMCETLYLPRYQVERVAVTAAIGESARALVELIHDLGAVVRGVELEHRAVFDGISVSGTVDLALEEPSIVLDFKWGKTTHRQRLERGAALQLALYAELVAAETGARPGVAYFTLRTQALYAEPGTMLADASVPGTATAEDIWRGARASIRRRVDELAVGQLHAPSADGSKLKSALGSEGLTIEPACMFCAFGGLCGRSGGK
jgi:ATP-dependent helicase/nuclease subunit B